MTGATLVTSFSRLAEYDGCPLRYRHLHVDGLPEPAVEPDWSRAPRLAPTVASPFDLVLGRVIHAALRTWQAGIDSGAKPVAETLLGSVRAGAATAGLDRDRLDRALAAESIGLCAYATGPWPRRRTLFLEKPVRLAISAADGFALELDLRLDRVAEYCGGTAILDFKSVPPHAPELRADRWQLRTYALAVAGLVPPPPKPLALFVIDVRRGRQLRVRASSSDIEGARDRLLQCAGGVSTGDFAAAGHPHRPCWSCGFRLQCPSSLSPRPPRPRLTAGPSGTEH